MYKVANNMSPDIMNEVFKLRTTPQYNLRHTSNFSTDPVHSVYNGTESASCLRQKFGIKYLLKLKDSLNDFKKEIKKWKPIECPCRICKTFVPNLGLFDKNINISKLGISGFQYFIYFLIFKKYF